MGYDIDLCISISWSLNLGRARYAVEEIVSKEEQEGQGREGGGLGRGGRG